MSSRREHGSVKQIAPGIYRVWVSGGKHPVTKERIRRSATVRGSKAEAERELARLTLEVGRVPADGARMSLQAYLDDMWLPSLSHVRRNTLDNYKAKLRLHVTPYLGHLRLEKVSAYSIEQWIRRLNDAGVGNHTQLHAFRILRAALRRAVRWQLIDRDPTDATTAPRPDSHDPEILTLDEARGFLEAFEGSPIEPAIVLALSAGLRRSEICGLDWSDVDFKKRQVRIHRGMHQRKGEVFFQDPKSRSSKRIVSLPKWAVEALRSRRGVGPLLIGADGHRMHPGALTARYRAERDRLKLRAVPLRDLRHTHATLALEAGVDVVAVSRRLGHSTITVTDSYYLRPHRSVDEAVADLVEILAPEGRER